MDVKVEYIDNKTLIDGREINPRGELAMAIIRAINRGAYTTAKNASTMETYFYVDVPAIYISEEEFVKEGQR